MMEKEITRILSILKPDGLKGAMLETPRRMESTLRYLTAGYIRTPEKVLKVFEEPSCDEMVFQGNIAVYSLCEHHILPFFGVAHVAYIPDKKIVGLSKIARVIEILSRRFQVQERLTAEIADTLYNHLNARGAGVVLRCRHMCMEMRGIKKPGTITYTSALRGCVKISGDAREEFMSFVQMADAKTSI